MNIKESLRKGEKVVLHRKQEFLLREYHVIGGKSIGDPRESTLEIEEMWIQTTHRKRDIRKNIVIGSEKMLPPPISSKISEIWGEITYGRVKNPQLVCWGLVNKQYALERLGRIAV